MSDNLKKKGYQDRSKINTSEPHEMKYWTKELGVSSQQLVGATRATGSSGVKTIKKYLKDKGAI